MNEELLQQILNELKEMKQEQQKINLRLNTIETDIKELKTGQQEIKNILTIQVPRTYEAYEKHMHEQDQKIYNLNKRVFDIEARLQI